jgi:hypothetical protein
MITYEKKLIQLLKENPNNLYNLTRLTFGVFDRNNKFETLRILNKLKKNNLIIYKKSNNKKDNKWIWKGDLNHGKN